MPPSTSVSQQRLFGMVLAAKRGQLKNPSPKIKKIAFGINEKSARDFAVKRESVAKSLMK
jgi:hypothetical protein